MKKIEKNKGITLIALIVTIIVLLILAGVTISTLTGESGIMIKASNAKKETAKANAEERVRIEVLGSCDESGNVNIEKLNENLRKIENLKYEGENLSEDNVIEELSATVSVDGYDIVIVSPIKVTE